MSNPPKRCIFCDGPNLTKEHVWPGWASDLLPESASFTIQRSTGDSAPHFVRTGQGAIKKQRLRVVCGPCNSGWMGTLETDVRPSLTPLILGDSTTLDMTAQRVLTEWVATKVMVLDYSYPPDAVVSREERHAFKSTRTIPMNMKMLIATCGDGRWNSASYRHAITASLTSQPPADRKKNVQVTTLGIGKALIHVATTTLEGFDLDKFVGVNDAIFRLWPYSGRPLIWPNTILTADAATALARRLDPLEVSPRTNRMP